MRAYSTVSWHTLVSSLCFCAFPQLQVFRKWKKGKVVLKSPTSLLSNATRLITRTLAFSSSETFLKPKSFFPDTCLINLTFLGQFERLPQRSISCCSSQQRQENTSVCKVTRSWGIISWHRLAFHPVGIWWVTVSRAQHSEGPDINWTSVRLTHHFGPRWNVSITGDWMVSCIHHPNRMNPTRFLTTWCFLWLFQEVDVF